MRFSDDSSIRLIIRIFDVNLFVLKNNQGTMIIGIVAENFASIPTQGRYSGKSRINKHPIVVANNPPLIPKQ